MFGEWLIMAHFVGDWALQSEWLAKNKGTVFMAMVAHSVIWAACVCVVLQWQGAYSLWKFGFLWLGHFAVDTWKCREEKTFLSWHLYMDQFLHLLQLICVSLI